MRGFKHNTSVYVFVCVQHSLDGAPLPGSATFHTDPGAAGRGAELISDPQQSSLAAHDTGLSSSPIAVEERKSRAPGMIRDDSTGNMLRREEKRGTHDVFPSNLNPSGRRDHG